MLSTFPRRVWRPTLILLALALIALAARPGTAAGTLPYTINFNAFTGAGFAPSPSAGQLDSDDWRVTGFDGGTLNFGGTQTSAGTDFARGTSSAAVTTGGVYAFTVGTGDNILGIQPGGDDFTPGTIQLLILNNTGSTVNALDVAYEIWYRNDQARANSLNFAYSTDGGTIFTAVPALNFTTPEASSGSSWLSTPRSTTLTGLGLADGSSIILAWTGDDVSGSGSRDEYGIDDVSVSVPAGDVTAPTLSSTNPADNATDVAVDANLVATFNENIQAGTGNIVINDVTNATTFATIPVGDAQVTISGATLTINPTGDLDPTTEYAVQIAAGAIEDTSGNDFAGIANNTTWSFTTVAGDVTAPTLSSTDPADNATDVAVDANLVATFDENIAAGTGDLVIYDVTNSATFATIAVGDAQVTISGATLTINPTGDLDAATEYAVQIAAGAIEDTSGNDFAGIGDTTTWSFTTAAAPPPPVADPLINEFVFNHTGSDTSEYIEIFGDPGSDYSDWTLLEIEGDFATPTNPQGLIDDAWPLGSTDANGFWWTGYINNAIENGTLTLLLVKDFSGAIGDDLDTNDDGTLDSTPWSVLSDAIALNDGGTGDLTYGVPVLGVAYDGQPFLPGGASRIPDGTDSDTAADWVRNDFDLADIVAGTPTYGEAYNTPGATNRSVLPPIVINEVDADTPSTDVAEFIELYDGGLGNISLDGFAIVFYNGNDDLSYRAYDLDTYSTDANGFFVLCGNAANVANCDLDVTPDSDLIQNGADAVALYAADAADFPTGTAVTTTDLIDAIVYDTSDADDAGLLVLLNSGQPQVDENSNSNSSGQSNQRCPDGGTARNTDSYTQATPTPGAANSCAPVSACGSPATLISAIQGTTNTPNFLGAVSIEGIVIGDFQGTSGMRGFYMQEEAADQDANPLTSEGIFIFDGSSPAVAVAVGDIVRVSGTVGQFNNNTQISSISAVEVCSSGNPLPAPVSVTLPEATNGDLERYEGMYVEITNSMTVAQTFFLGRYGQLTLSSGGRLFQPTQIELPGSPEAAALAADNQRHLLILDDAFEVSSLGDNPNPVPYLGAPPPAVLRSGDTVANLVGVLDHGRINASSPAGTDYRLQPTAAPVFTAANPRQATPDDVGGAVKVAAFNVLNYFNGNGLGGGFPTSRGAGTLAEFNRQRDKIIAAISAMDVDIVGLMEIENDGYGATSAIQDLVNGLNDADGPGTWEAVDLGGPIGSDEIAVGVIYKPAGVTIVGSPAVLDAASFVDPLSSGTDKNRPAVAVTFESVGGNPQAVFTVVMNHLKSKGSGCGAGDDDPEQGNCNGTRTAAATALLTWLDSDPTATGGDTDFLIMGDLNSYAKEDPIQTLLTGTRAGYVDLAQQLIGTSAYSYIFDGLSGTLDYAIASSSMATQVSGATEWHINTDEPPVIDYDQEFNPAGYYSANAYRSSDHDPIIVGIDVPNAIELAAFAGAATGDTVRLTWETASEIDTAGFHLYRAASADGARTALNAQLIAAQGAQGLGAAYAFDDRGVPAGTWYYWLADVSTGGHATLHGPIAVEVRVPTAVTLSGAAAGDLTNLADLSNLLLVALALLGAASLRARRRRTND